MLHFSKVNDSGIVNWPDTDCPLVRAAVLASRSIKYFTSLSTTMSSSPSTICTSSANAGIVIKLKRSSATYDFVNLSGICVISKKYIVCKIIINYKLRCSNNKCILWSKPRQHLLYLLYKFTIYAKSNHEKQRGILSGLSKYHAQNMVLRYLPQNHFNLQNIKKGRYR